MTSIWGNDNGGGGSGANGHRVIITYSYSQNILGNYTDVSWQVGIDYGDPNYWNNIRNRSYSFGLVTGSSISAVSGSLSGSDATIINTSDPGYGGQIHYFYSGTARITHNGSGQGTINMQASARFNGSYDSNINSNVALPDIPQNPADPSSVTSVRTSDTQASLSWTNNSTGTAPYANIKVYRAVDAGSFSLLTTLGVVTSYSDTTTSANHRYRYKVSAVGTNTAESGQVAAAAAVYMTPGTPTIGTATKQLNNDVVLTWTNNCNYGDSSWGTDIYESQNGGSFVYLASVGSGTSFTHVAPSTAVTHAYKVLHTKGALFSALSAASNTVTLLSTAAAPTGLAPAGVARDAAEVIVFTWTHNPTDGTPQSKYQLQYKIGAGSFVTVGPTTSGVSSYSMPASTLTNGNTITWHVATAGQNGTIGAYSADSTFTASARPTSTISVPSGGSYSQSLLTTSWAYFQANGSAQALWHAYLYKVTAGPTYTTLEEKTGTTESSTSFTTPLVNGQQYAVRVYLTSAVGLESINASTELETFTVAFQPPAPATISAVYVDDTGRAIVTVVGSSAVASIQALTLDGTGDWGSTVDNAALDITGDIDIMADIIATDWTPSTMQGIVEKWLTASNLSYALALDTAGKLRFRITTSGVIGTLVEGVSSVAVGAADGSRLSVRARRVGTTVTFYTSTDTDLSTATWSTLGTTATVSGTIFSGTSALTIGSNGSGAALNGKVFSALVKNSAGTTVAYPIYSVQPAGTTSFADAPGRTWTLVDNASISVAIPGLEAIDHIDIQRRINGGAWVTWAAGIVLPGDFTVNVTDVAPITNGLNEYQALVFSALPSSTVSNIASLSVDDELWGFLGYGNNFSTIVKMRARLAMRVAVGRSKATYYFAGRSKPVELSGEQTRFGLAVSATLMGPSNGGVSSEPSAIEAAAITTGPVLWRDHTGRRVFASLSDVIVDYTTLANKYPVSFNLTEVDFDENVG